VNDPARASAINRLRAFARPGAPRAAVERCDVCGAELAPEHDHLVSAGALALSCACLACVASPPAGLLVVVPRLERVDPRRAAAAWDRLALPVGLGFILHASAPVPRWIARLPGAAGATLAELSDDAGAAIAEAIPTGLRPDVEALLFDRARAAACVVSIDRCFELTGTLRAGGDADAFFAALDRGANRG
jgi:hypothetical protein